VLASGELQEKEEEEEEEEEGMCALLLLLPLLWRMVVSSRCWTKKAPSACLL